MSRRLISSRPGRLLALFVIATVLPAGALAWLGWRLVEQDRQLERQRVEDLLDGTATTVAAAIERELAAIERNLSALAGPGEDALSSNDAVALRATRTAGVTSIAGARLLYEPLQRADQPDPFDERWAEAEIREFAHRDTTGAMSAYRAIARSSDPNVRAGALIRLARAQRRSGQTDEALNTYAQLATIERATLLATPADLVARWARIDLLSELGRVDAARAEAASLAEDLQRGRWRLDRTTYLTYADALEESLVPQRDELVATRRSLSEAVDVTWKAWQSGAKGTDSRRHSLQTDSNEILVVSRADDDELLVFAATPAFLTESWHGVWAATDLAVALVDRNGQVVAGALPESTTTVTRQATDTGLPWTIRVAAASMPGEIAASGAARRRVIVTGLVLLGVLIPATGYMVARSVRKELALARQQAEFIAAVSHEFRSPLTSLSHLTSLLRSDFQPSEARRSQYYEVMARETDRLRRFVETLLDFGRIQAGAARYHLVPLDLDEVVRDVVAEFRCHAASAGHEVSYVAATGALVNADSEALGRAVWNLLENAAKYSPADSPIAVRLDVNESQVTIGVSDRGPGIPAAEQPFVFDQFFRGQAAAASTTKGTGVGLAVVRHIVKGHGGEVGLESAPGAGSTFSIVLPLSAESVRGVRLQADQQQALRHGEKAS